MVWQGAVVGRPGSRWLDGIIRQLRLDAAAQRRRDHSTVQLQSARLILMDAATRYLTGCSCKAHGECHASRWTAGNKANHTQECAPGIMQSVQQPQQQQQPCVAWRSEEEMRACSVEVTRRDGYSRTFLQYLQSVETDVTKKKGSARREKTITRGAPRPRGRRAAAGGLAATRPGDLYRGERSRDGQRGL